MGPTRIQSIISHPSLNSSYNVIAHADTGRFKFTSNLYGTSQKISGILDSKPKLVHFSQSFKFHRLFKRHHIYSQRAKHTPRESLSVGSKGGGSTQAWRWKREVQPFLIRGQSKVQPQFVTPLINSHLSRVFWVSHSHDHVVCLLGSQPNWKLGDYPPRDRTSELRVFGFPRRHLGPVQMTTDTALGVTKIVVHDKGKWPIHSIHLTN